MGSAACCGEGSAGSARDGGRPLTTAETVTFGELLRRFRKAAGLTQEQLAERAGLSRRGINDLERGARRTPRRDTLTLLIEALKLAEEHRAALHAAARRRVTVAGADVTPVGDVQPQSQGAVDGAGRSVAAAPAAPRQRVVAPAADQSPTALPGTPRSRSMGNLPTPLTPIIGREHEEAAAVHLLRREDVRLLTLTGAPGIGKTRLALQVAADLQVGTNLQDDAPDGVFPDGVFLVELAPISEPGLVLATIMRTLEVRETGGETTTPLAALAAHLRTRRLLLLLDNFEQVVTAAPQVAELLRACSGLKVLVTSRIRLHVQGEHQLTVPPLALPDLAVLPPAEQLVQYPAVALFVQRAQDAQPDFQATTENAPAVAEICARLDGLPLAIELAAARVNLLPPQHLLQRLERRLPLLTGGAQDLETRQQTMRATLAWSDELLTPEECTLFRRLAVFVGGCTLEAAETICFAPEGAAPLSIDVLDGVGRLMDQSLLQHWEERGEARFGLLQVVREYALEQLEASEEATALRRAHATYYLRLAEIAEPGLLGSQVRTWLRRLARELDNLRAALAWARDQRDLELCLRASRALVEFHVEAGDVREVWHWLQALLALVLPAGLSQDGVATAVRTGFPAPVLAKALDDAGAVAGLAGEVDESVQLLEHSLALCRTLGDRAGEGQALFDLGVCASRQGDLAQAVRLYEASLELLREAGDPWWITYALACLADQRSRLGEFNRAEALLEEALPLARALENPIRLSLVLINLGDVAREQGDWSRSLALEREALAQAKAIAKNRYVALALAGIGLALSAQGLSEPAVPTQQCAVRLLAAAISYFERIGLPEHSIADSHPFERAVMVRHAILGDAGFAAAWDAGRALSLEEAISEALGTEQQMCAETHRGMR
jgi:predicted ATPase/DNA-binding XRE family transcriptional regulator